MTPGVEDRHNEDPDGDLDSGPEVWRVPVDDLVRHWDPFEAWCDTPITVDEVQEAIDADWLAPEPFDTMPWGLHKNDDAQARHYHRCRIAWMVVHRDDTPIEIDVGAPSLGWTPRRPPFDFIDGNHRLCAAVLRGDATIRVGYGGECDRMAVLFPRGWVEQLAEYV